jgi:hypothetical protein
VLDPVAVKKRVVLVEIAVVEHQQKFTAVRIEALNRMRNAGRKVPQVADADVVHEVPSVGVLSRLVKAVEDMGPARWPERQHGHEEYDKQ